MGSKMTQYMNMFNKKEEEERKKENIEI